MPELDPVRSRVLAILRRHGWNATSFQVLEPGFHYWFADDDGCVAYVDTGRAWVAAGAPLCTRERLMELAERFAAEAAHHRRRLAFFAVESRFVESLRWPNLLVGEQPEWDTHLWPQTVHGSSSLREQLRRARAKGVSIRTASREELASPEAPLRRSLEVLVSTWLGRHEMAPLGFLVQVDPLTLLKDHQVHVAEARGQLVGFLSASPVFSRGAWLFQNLVRAPNAPNGTAELLVDHAMKAASKTTLDGSASMVTLGLAPLAGAVQPALRWARSAGAVLFDFDGLHAFKARLRPTRWTPIYLTFPPRQGAVATVLDVLSAFARGRLFRFGLQSLLRGPLIVVRLLAVLLVPWTILLALVDPWHFPAHWVQWAWVAFDVGLTLGLFRLAARWNDRLLLILTALIGADVVATTAEVLLWNLARIRGPADVLVAAVAILAPTLAFTVLWRARLRRRAPVPPGVPQAAAGIAPRP
jgi:phosphatidylglycerol lysyltransferase